MVGNIYDSPELYDLEHEGHGRDIEFFQKLCQRFRPDRVLELGCGNGRVTIPVAQTIGEWGGSASGLDLSESMLEAAKSHRGAGAIEWIRGDIRTHEFPDKFDLIVSPCASLSHLATLDDLLAAWRTAHRNLRADGRFVVVEQMADLPALADSMVTPPRLHVQFDSERVHAAGQNSERLLRYRTVRYSAHRQQMRVRYLYDHFSAGHDDAERHLSDYRAHVFFPYELRLLFLATGFQVEEVLGSFAGEELRHTSRQQIVIGKKMTI